MIVLRWRLLSASIIISLLLGFIFLDYHFVRGIRRQGCG